MYRPRRGSNLLSLESEFLVQTPRLLVWLKDVLSCLVVRLGAVLFDPLCVECDFNGWWVESGEVRHLTNAPREVVVL